MNAIITSIAVQANEHAQGIILNAAKEEAKATANAGASALDAASDCDSLPVFAATLAGAKAQYKKDTGVEFRTDAPSLDRYLGTLRAAWEDRPERLRKVNAALDEFKANGWAIPDTLAPAVLRFRENGPEGFLIPADTRYKKMSQYDADAVFHKELEKALAHVKTEAKKLADKAAALVAKEVAAAVAKDRATLGANPQGMASGGDSGTVEMPENVKAARSRVLSTLHGNMPLLAGFPTDSPQVLSVVAMLDHCERELSGFFAALGEAQRAEREALGTGTMDKESAEALADAVAETEAAA